MPIDKSLRSAPGLSAAERLAQHQVLVAGTSPLNRDRTPPPRPDTSVTERCEQCRPHATFIAIGDRSAEDNLQAHIEIKHQPKVKKVAAAESAAAVKRVAETITDRIADGSLRPGMPVKQVELVSELGTSRHYTQAAIEQLVEAGALRWTAATSAYTRRTVVCWPLDDCSQKATSNSARAPMRNDP